MYRGMTAAVDSVKSAAATATSDPPARRMGNGHDKTEDMRHGYQRKEMELSWDNTALDTSTNNSNCDNVPPLCVLAGMGTPTAHTVVC